MPLLYTKGSLRARDLLSLAVRVFKAKPLRMALTILGMGVGVGVVLFLVSFGYGLQYILLGNIASTQDALVTVEAYFPPESKLKIDADTLRKIRDIPGVSEVSPLTEVMAEITSGESSGYVIARIVDEKYFRLSGASTELFSGAVTGPDDVIISKAALLILGKNKEYLSQNRNISADLSVPVDTVSGSAETVEVKTTRLPRLVVSGLIADEAEVPAIYIPEKAATFVSKQYERVFVKAESVEQVATIKDRLIDLGFGVSARLDLINQARKILDAATVILGIFGVASLVVSAIGMFNTMMILFMERTFEVGIMKALGARDKDIRNLFLVEALLVGILGGLGGISLGIGFSNLFNFGLNALARNLGGKAVDLFIRPWWFLALIMAISSLIGILSGIVPALRAAKLSPKQAFAKK